MKWKYFGWVSIPDKDKVFEADTKAQANQIVRQKILELRENKRNPGEDVNDFLHRWFGIKKNENLVTQIPDLTRTFILADEFKLVVEWTPEEPSTTKAGFTSTGLIRYLLTLCTFGRNGYLASRNEGSYNHKRDNEVAQMTKQDARKKVIDLLNNQHRARIDVITKTKSIKEVKE